jgi:hypothetical protein
MEQEINIGMDHHLFVEQLTGVEFDKFVHTHTTTDLAGLPAL